MTRQRSARRIHLSSRVALTATLVLAIWVITSTAAVNVLLGARLTGDARALLRTRAQATAAAVEIGTDGQVRVEDSRDDATIDLGTWVFVGTKAVQTPGADRVLDLEAALLTGRGRVWAETPGLGGLLWYAEPVGSGAHPVVTVVTSVPLAPYRSTERTVLAATVIVWLLMLAATYGVLQVSVRRALRPVASMTHQAARWSAEDVDRRFGSQLRAPELDDLAHTLDGLLDRLSAVLRHERRLSAEISHELRTPLARMLAEIEILQADPLRAGAVASTLDSLQSTTVEMASIVEDLMTVGRTHLRTPPGRCEVVAAIGAAVDRRPDRSRLRLVATGRVMAGLEASQLDRALSPILDNAVRYARSHVDIVVRTDRAAVVIEVCDDGPGISVDDLPHIFEPGRRGVRAAAEHDGAGLGLGLARRLITAAGGSVQARSSAAGAVFTLVLPAA